MSGQDLFAELQSRTALLDKALAQIKKRGRMRGETEMNYREALTKEIMKERESGTPVTIISDICRGKREIAQLRFERDVADVTYKAALEAINVYKLEVNLLREQIDREWNRSGNV